LPAIHPFSGAEELINSTIRCFSEVRPDYGTFLQTMDQRGFLDLDSRKGQAPGGFNYPLYESNIPFVFMNSTGNLRDLETMLHEGGHAIHSFLSNNLELVDFKSLSAEIAELASMSMELIAMDHGADFFEDIEEYRRARRTYLEGIIKILPWIATVDKFQHWVYTHPEHSESERDHAWVEIAREFAGTFIDYSGIEECFTYAWQKQLHLFEVPFYYIEYGIAQLGAIAVWRNYRTNRAKTLEQFSKALSLGYSVPIPQVYKTAGIEFNFSGPYIMELIDFVWGELKVLDSLPSS
jgi:oligoendopeptidase F